MCQWPSCVTCLILHDSVNVTIYLEKAHHIQLATNLFLVLRNFRAGNCRLNISEKSEEELANRNPPEKSSRIFSAKLHTEKATSPHKVKRNQKVVV